MGLALRGRASVLEHDESMRLERKDAAGLKDEGAFAHHAAGDLGVENLNEAFCRKVLRQLKRDAFWVRVQ